MLYIFSLCFFSLFLYYKYAKSSKKKDSVKAKTTFSYSKETSDAIRLLRSKN